MATVDLLRLREAIEASWDAVTAYQHLTVPGNPAYGPCYPTARVVQHFLPETEIAQGEVWSDDQVDTHFWNVLVHNGVLIHIDLSWQQFPPGSTVCRYEIRDRATLLDSAETTARCEMLLHRVAERLAETEWQRSA